MAVKKSLATQLSAKAASLRATQAEKSNAAAALVVAAENAASDSDLAGAHATAVEKAVRILEDAGVTA